MLTPEQIAEILIDKENLYVNWYTLVLDIIDKQNQNISKMLGIAVAMLAVLMIVCTIAILRSQKKTQKMLRELAEAQKKQEEDKP